VKAALRLVAAQLSAQPTQQRRWDDQVILAIKDYTEAWAAHRKKTEAVSRSAPRIALAGGGFLAWWRRKRKTLAITI